MVSEKKKYKGRFRGQHNYSNYNEEIIKFFVLHVAVQWVRFDHG